MESKEEEIKSEGDFHSNFKFLAKEEIEKLSLEERRQYGIDIQKYLREFSRLTKELKPPLQTHPRHCRRIGVNIEII